MSGEKTKPVPKLRFPEFRSTAGWMEQFGDSLFDQISDRNPEPGLPVLAITQEHGAIPRHMIDYHVSVTEKSIESYKVVQVGDFIISLRSFQGGIEYSQYHGICSPAYVVLRRRGEGSDAYFKNYLKTDRFIQILTKNLEGLRDGKMISYKQFSELQLPVPESREQKKIADCLGSLDELFTAQACKVDALKTHKKGLMQQLFPREGETQPRLRFPEFRDAGEWEEGLISDLATTVMGNAFRSTDFVESGTQVVRIGNLYQGELQLKRAPVYLSDAQAEENAKFGVHPLDLLMSMTGTVGKRDYGFVIQVPPDCKPLLLNQRVMKLAPTVKCDSGFLLQLLKSDRLLDAIYSVPGGTKQANLSAQHIKDLLISYPPKSEQQRIALCLSSLDALITLETQKLETLKTHKKGLMQQLFPSAEAVEA
ncbi:MAG: restriction endonuclease subunit S [Verminephrobacter sp.]|nr:restriction endonuclease subunit S [Verminephrobacter sp.]